MKKMKKIILSAILFVSVIMLSGCFGTNSKPITANDFYTLLKKQNFTVTDVTDQYSEYDHMKKVYVARNPDLTYQIEFIEVSDVEKAKMVYDHNKKIFETSLGKVVKGKLDVTLKDVSKYRAVSAGSYMALTRIDNTIIYVRVPEDYQKEVSKIIKKLGY